MTPWAILLAQLPQLVDRLEAAGHPLLVVEVDGEIVLRLARPSRADLEAHARWPGMSRITPEEWLRGVLAKLGRRYPHPREGVVVRAGPHPVAVVRRPGGTEADTPLSVPN